jgi:hypothetical protein
MYMNSVNNFLLNHNREQSDFFLSPDEVAKRNLYQALHPTKVKVKKCMDGRVNVPAMTDGEIPMGIISPFRNMGGKFVIGSPSYAHFVRNFYEYAERAMIEEHSPGGMVFVTYHYSAGDKQRGCKGFGYDTDAARAYTAGLKRDCDRVYGPRHEVVHPIHMGIETDKEAFVFHGDVPGTVLDMAEAVNLSPEQLKVKMRELYPEMRNGIFNDLMPFAIGNQRHVRKVVAANRPVATLDHHEQIVAVGRGFDWLHLINKALIVGPFSVDWPREVAVAASIVLDNFEKGRIPVEEGAVLLVSAPYRNHGVDAAVAREKAIEMARISREVIETTVPELLKYNFEVVVGTLDRNTMLLHRLDEDHQVIQFPQHSQQIHAHGQATGPVRVQA